MTPTLLPQQQQPQLQRPLNRNAQSEAGSSTAGSISFALNLRFCLPVIYRCAIGSDMQRVELCADAADKQVNWGTYMKREADERGIRHAHPRDACCPRRTVFVQLGCKSWFRYVGDNGV